MQTFNEQIGDWIKFNRTRLVVSAAELPLYCRGPSTKVQLVEGIESGRLGLLDWELLPIIRVFIRRAKERLALKR